MKNKYGWNYCHRFKILPLLGGDHCLPILHTAKKIFMLMKNMNILIIFQLDI